MWRMWDKFVPCYLLPKLRSYRRNPLAIEVKWAKLYFKIEKLWKRSIKLWFAVISKTVFLSLLLELIRIANTAVGIRHADHVEPLYPQKLALTSPTSGGQYSSLSDSGHRVVFFITCPSSQFSRVKGKYNNVKWTFSVTSSCNVPSMSA
jgi:hypothetical protein